MYEADRWRDKSIISQCSLKAAVDLVTALGCPEGMDVGQAVIQWQAALYGATVALCGDDTQGQNNVQFSSGGGRKGEVHMGQPDPKQHQSGYEKPYASTVINFGMYKGLTIAQIDQAVGEGGKTGHSWLEWAVNNTNSDFTKTAIRRYLDA